MSRLTKTILYAFYFIAVIALGAVIVMSFTDKHPTKQPKTLANKPSTSQNASTTGSNSKSSSGPHGASTKTTSSSSNQNMTKTNQPSTQALSNTGPGNYVALFIGASVVGSILYRRRIISRSN